MTRARASRVGGGMIALLLAIAWPAVAPVSAEGDARDGDAAAAVAEAAAEDADGVVVHVTRGASGLEVDARCVVRAPASIAWAVLTDYDGIDRFVSSMRESRIAGRGDHHVLVEQVAVSRLLLFRRRFHATLFVEEVPPTTIRFEDVLGRDFESYRGEWRIEEQPDGATIVYRVAAQPHTSVPDFLARGLFRRTARDLLAQVRAEIERRSRPG